MEGSVEVDNGGMPATHVEDTNSQEEVIETRDEGTDEGEGESQGQGQGGKSEKQKLTDKGTKLDENPLSAAHQQLANAQRRLQDYERVLSDPKLLKRYAEESGFTLAEAKAELKDEAKKARFTADRFKTGDDVAAVLNEMEERHEAALAELRKQNADLRAEYEGLTTDRKLEKMVATTQADVSTIQSTYPELNPKDPAYDPELEKEIADMYVELDAVDPRDPSRGFKGNYSLAKLTDRVMRAAGKAKQRGSKDAQTEVRVKQAGRVVTSSKGTPSGAGESKDPGTTIAQRIARAMGNIK